MAVSNLFVFMLLLVVLCSLNMRCSATYQLQNNSRLFFIGGTHVYHGAAHTYGFVNTVSDELSKAKMNVVVSTFSDISKGMLDLRSDLRHEVIENELIQAGDVIILMAGNDDINDLNVYIDERDNLMNNIEGNIGQHEGGAEIEPAHIEGIIRQRQYAIATHWYSLISLLLEIRDIKIIVSTSFLQGEKVDFTNKLDEFVDEFNGAIKLYASEQNIEIFDLRQFFLTKLEELNFENLPSSVLTYDGFNLNEIGHKYAAYFLLQSLEVKHSLVFYEDPSLQRLKEMHKRERNTVEHVDLNSLDVSAMLKQLNQHQPEVAGDSNENNFNNDYNEDMATDNSEEL